jgi:hypothetical protein
MPEYVDGLPVPELDWEPIWFWKPVCEMGPPVEALLPPDYTLWRVPVEEMKPGKTYTPKGQGNISFKVVKPGTVGKRFFRQTRIDHYMKCKRTTSSY